MLLSTLTPDGVALHSGFARQARLVTFGLSGNAGLLEQYDSVQLVLLTPRAPLVGTIVPVWIPTANPFETCPAFWAIHEVREEPGPMYRVIGTVLPDEGELLDTRETFPDRTAPSWPC